MVSTMAGVTPTGISTNSNSFGILVGIQHFHKWQTGIEWARQLLLSFVHQISFKSRPVVCLPSKKHVKQHFAIQDWKCYSTGVMNWLLKSQAYHNPSCQRGWSAISGATDLTISPTFGGWIVIICDSHPQQDRKVNPYHGLTNLMIITIERKWLHTHPLLYGK